MGLLFATLVAHPKRALAGPGPTMFCTLDVWFQGQTKDSLMFSGMMPDVENRGPIFAAFRAYVQSKYYPDRILHDPDCISGDASDRRSQLTNDSNIFNWNLVDTGWTNGAAASAPQKLPSTARVAPYALEVTPVEKAPPYATETAQEKRAKDLDRLAKQRKAALEAELKADYAKRRAEARRLYAECKAGVRSSCKVSRM